MVNMVQSGPGGYSAQWLKRMYYLGQKRKTQNNVENVEILYTFITLR